ncbi:MAG: helix-turn-helix transcriptional regulator [Chloroflexi bacterium]|nr:helix-turn-helix transcriptional regulator [Chloroflexota bacterium]
MTSIADILPTNRSQTQLGHLIDRYVDAQGILLIDFAKRTGLSSPTILAIRKDKDYVPYPRTLERIAEATDTPLEAVKLLFEGGYRAATKRREQSRQLTYRRKRNLTKAQWNKRQARDLPRTMSEDTRAKLEAYRTRGPGRAGTRTDESRRRQAAYFLARPVRPRTGIWTFCAGCDGIMYVDASRAKGRKFFFHRNTLRPPGRPNNNEQQNPRASCYSKINQLEIRGRGRPPESAQDWERNARWFVLGKLGLGDHEIAQQELRELHVTARMVWSSRQVFNRRIPKNATWSMVWRLVGPALRDRPIRLPL